MGNDEELKACVNAEIARDPSLADAEIAVIVKDGVVTITGHVDTIARKEAVQRAVRYSSGASGIAFELDAKSDFGHKASDSEIAHAALAALAARSGIPRNRIGVEVENGWVTLSGELGNHPNVEIARQCLADIPGIRGLCCCIRVAPTTAERR